MPGLWNGFEILSGAQFMALRLMLLPEGRAVASR